MKRTLVMVALAGLLGACGSSVKLDKVPVEDKSASSAAASAGANAGSADGSAVGKSAVASVDLSKSGQDAAMQSTTRVVYFDYDSYAIRPEFQSVIEAHARYIRADKARKVVIEGHTDERGGREYNLALGQKRAQAVVNILRVQGVAERQMEAISFGKEKPRALGHDEAAHAENRRVDLAYPPN